MNPLAGNRLILTFAVSLVPDLLMGEKMQLSGVFVIQSALTGTCFPCRQTTCQANRSNICECEIRTMDRIRVLCCTKQVPEAWDIPSGIFLPRHSVGAAAEAIRGTVCSFGIGLWIEAGRKQCRAEGKVDCKAGLTKPYTIHWGAPVHPLAIRIASCQAEVIRPLCSYLTLPLGLSYDWRGRISKE